MTGGQCDSTTRRVNLCQNGVVVSDRWLVSVLINMCYHSFPPRTIYSLFFRAQNNLLSLFFPPGVSSFEADGNEQATFLSHVNSA